MFLSNLHLHILVLVLSSFIQCSLQKPAEPSTESQNDHQSNQSDPQPAEDDSEDEAPLADELARQSRMYGFWDYYNTPYNAPYSSPYTTSYPAPYTSQYTSPYSSPYGVPYATPYSAPYTSPYSSPYSSPYTPQYTSQYSSQYYPITQPAFLPYVYYGGYNQYESNDDEGVEVDISSRANSKRRPGGNRRTQYQDSPIFYIRLPPTPYMFVPGSGYMSQPPTFNPLIPMPPVSPPMPAIPPPMQPVGPVGPMPVSPFISIPLNFVSNARPTSIYHFGSSLSPPYTVPQPPSLGPQFGMPGVPAIPSYQPTRRPSRPKPSLSDSQVTHLKGQYLFNGRPNQIYVLTNSPPNPVYTGRMNPYY